jgi:hypothetical protein
MAALDGFELDVNPIEKTDTYTTYTATKQGNRYKARIFKTNIIASYNLKINM